MQNMVGPMKREPSSFWDHNTEDFNKDICDVIALHLRRLIEEDKPYNELKLVGDGEETSYKTKNPGWMDAALFATDLINPDAQISNKLKEVLVSIRNRTEVILNATKNVLVKEGPNESLHEMVELYHDLISKIDQILA